MLNESLMSHQSTNVLHCSRVRIQLHLRILVGVFHYGSLFLESPLTENFQPAGSANNPTSEIAGQTGPDKRTRTF